MRLFDVSSGRRVMITSDRIRWADDFGEVTELGRQVTWSGMTTVHYWTFEQVERRLIVNHTLEWHREDGVWQRDVDCLVIG